MYVDTYVYAYVLACSLASFALACELIGQIDTDTYADASPSPLSPALPVIDTDTYADKDTVTVEVEAYWECLNRFPHWVFFSHNAPPFKVLQSNMCACASVCVCIAPLSACGI